MSTTVVVVSILKGKRMKSKNILVIAGAIILLGVAGYKIIFSNESAKNVDNEVSVSADKLESESEKNAIEFVADEEFKDKLSFNVNGKTYTLGPIPAHKWKMVTETQLVAEHFNGSEPFAWASDVSSDTKLYDVEGFVGSCVNGYQQDKPEQEGYVHFHGSNEDSSVGFWLKHTAVTPFTWQGPDGNPGIGREVPVGVDLEFPNICEFPAGASEKEASNTENVPTASDSNVVEINMTAEQWKFTPNEVRVKLGDTVRMTVTSLDVTHGFAINELNVNETIPAGETVTFEFVANKKGTFRQYCSILCGVGHSGMDGNFIVE